jgi:hypothetical protein
VYWGNKPGDKRCKACSLESAARSRASETPEQAAARLERGREYYKKHRESLLLKQRDYVARTKEQKRAYDIAYRSIKNTRRRMKTEQRNAGA